MKRRYTRGGRGREGRVVSSLFPHPLFFFHPVETVNGFLLGGGWLAATPPLRFEAIRPALFSLLSFRRFFFIRSRASSSLSPSLSLLSTKIPRPRETIVSWTRATFQGRSIRRLSYFYYRLVPLFLLLFPSISRIDRG